jgi:uncharacterized damage-inducible protein DinB
MNDTNLRNNLIELLKGGHAHVSVEQALDAIDPSWANIRAAGLQHSIWEVLEHMRITQEDILRYTLDANWQSPSFPEGYWGTTPDKMMEKDLSDSTSRFFADLDEVIKLVQKPDLDLTEEIPHGEGRTYLREILLIADHNSYHMAQIVQVRKALGHWPT